MNTSGSNSTTNTSTGSLPPLSSASWPEGQPASDPDDTISQPGGTGTDAAVVGALPAMIGEFRIVRVIGEGGMGLVYEAEQTQPRRTVALKVIRPGWVTPAMLRRFDHEVELLGRLEHPAIARIYAAGTADTGHGPQPYFAMELVTGEPLVWYSNQSKLSINDRLQLLIKLCDGVQHAHGKGIIHRDLKPGNVLVTSDGQPKILDFGVARAIDSDVQSPTVQTDMGQLIGTLQYMSPEQAAGNPALLDTRSDIYSLGVIAYELLSGQLLYDLKALMIHEVVRVIREHEPTRLSSVNREFRGDLETIVSKALQKEKERRYQTASEFAADIHRHLENRPITARPPSAMYQFRKFARRNRTFTAAAFMVLLALVLGIAGTSMGMVRAKHQRNRAEVSEAQVKKQLAESYIAAAKLAMQRGNSTDALERLDKAMAVGGAGEITVRLLRADVLFDENRAREAAAELKVVDGLRLSPAQAAESNFQHARLAGLTNWDRNQSYLKLALAGPLSPSHEHFAKAQFALTLPDAARELRLALDADPYDKMTVLELSFCETLIGPGDRGLARLDALALIYPDDRDLRIDRLIIAEMLQAPGVETHIDRDRFRGLPKEEIEFMEQMAGLCETARDFLRDDILGMTFQAEQAKKDLEAVEKKFLEAWPIAQRYVSSDDSQNAADFNLAGIPPAGRTFLGKLVKLYGFYLIGADRSSLSTLSELIDILPWPGFIFQRERIEFSLQMYDEAKKDADRIAAAGVTMVDCRKEAAFMGVFATILQPLTQHPAVPYTLEEVRADLAAVTECISRYGSLPALYCPLAVREAVRTEQFDTAVKIAASINPAADPLLISSASDARANAWFSSGMFSTGVNEANEIERRNPAGSKVHDLMIRGLDEGGRSVWNSVRYPQRILFDVADPHPVVEPADQSTPNVLFAQSRRVELRQNVVAFDLAPDGKSLLLATHGGLAVLHLADHKESRPIPVAGTIRKALIALDGRLVVIVGDFQGHHQLRVLGLRSGPAIGSSIDRFDVPPGTLRLDPSGQIAQLMSDRGVETVNLRSVKHGSWLPIDSPQDVPPFLIAAHLLRLDATTAKLLPVGPGRTVELPQPAGQARFVAVSPDDTRLLTAAVSGDHDLRIWNSSTGDLECTLPMASAVTAAAFSADASIVVAADDTGSLQARSLPAMVDLARDVSYPGRRIVQLEVDPGDLTCYCLLDDGTLMAEQLDPLATLRSQAVLQNTDPASLAKAVGKQVTIEGGVSYLQYSATGQIGSFDIERRLSVVVSVACGAQLDDVCGGDAAAAIDGSTVRVHGILSGSAGRYTLNLNVIHDLQIEPFVVRRKIAY